MAHLRNLTTGHVVLIPARCGVGRSRVCDLVLGARDVSSQHAVVQWTGCLWELQDLSSRNGTYLDDRRLGAGERVPLRAGAVLRFARADVWALVDIDPPIPLAMNLSDGRIQPAENGLISLPGVDNPHVLVHGIELGRWYADRDGDRTEVRDRELVHVDGEAWRLHLSVSATATLDSDDGSVDLATVALHFAHTPDEEYIELTAIAGPRRLNLHARNHNYVLLLLARARLAHQASALPPEEQGWIHQERLLEMLRIDSSHLNITIHRARVHLAQCGLRGAANLVERRKGTRQMRIGVARVSVAPL